MMIILIGAISIFGLGYATNEWTNIPTAYIIAGCFAAQVGILIAYNKRGKK